MILSTPKNPDDRQLRQFYVYVPTALLVAAAVLLYLSFRRTHTLYGWPGLVATMVSAGALTLLLIRWCSPAYSRLVYELWMMFGAALSGVTSTIVLTILYFTLLAPFALLRRKDPLNVRGVARASYWHTSSEYPATLDRMRRSF